MRRSKSTGQGGAFQALAGLARELEGAPLDPARPQDDWWLVVPFLLLPAFALAQAVLG